MGYKENRKREAERWGDQANSWVGRRAAAAKAMQRITGKFTKEIWDENGDLITIEEPQFIQSVGDNRALKITKTLLDEIKTRWLICPQPHHFTFTGISYWTDHLRVTQYRRYLYMGDDLMISVLCTNPKRGVWKIYIRKNQ